MFDFTSDISTALNECGELVIISLFGVVIKTISGIFDLTSEAVSPFEASNRIGKPSVTLLDSDIENITSEYTLTIRNKDYCFDGKPMPDGHGMTLIYLQGKK